MVLAGVSAGAYRLVSAREAEQLVRSKERAATMVTDLFASGASAPLSFADDPGVREHLTQLAANPAVVYAAVWGADANKLGALVSATGQSAVVPSSPPTLHTNVEVLRLPHAVVVDRPVMGSAGEVLGMARVAMSLDAENEAIEASRSRTLFTVLALALSLGAVIIALTRTLIVRRLGRLASAAKRVEEGGSFELDEDSIDEVGSLARALASMGTAIASREAQLSARTRDMRRVLDNVTEGLVTVDKSARMSDERSRVLDDWFGPPPESRDLIAFFASFAPEASEWIEVGWQALVDDVVPAEVVLDQMGRRFVHGGRTFEVAFMPIWKAPDVVDEVLMVIRDITSAVERERAEQGQREGMIVFRRVLDDRRGFEDFLHETNHLLERVGDASSPTIARDLHTLKGNTAIFGLESISSVCHRIETRIQDDVGNTLHPSELAELRAACARVSALYEDLVSSSHAPAVEVSLEEHEALLVAIESRRPHAELAATVRTFKGELAGPRLERIAAQGRSLAKRLGKAHTVVATEVSPPYVRLPAERWRPFWAAFAHVIRNTFDHGVESPDERKRSGKPADAHVTLRLSASRSGVEVSIHDDGRGIAWDKIRESAKKNGLPCSTPAELEAALFAERVSSRSDADETSGRGLGMGAVRDAVEAAGGTLSIETESGRGTTLRFRFQREMLSDTAPSISASAREDKVAS